MEVSYKIEKNNSSKHKIWLHFLIYLSFIPVSYFLNYAFYPYPVMSIISAIWLIGLCGHYTAYRIKSRRYLKMISKQEILHKNVKRNNSKKHILIHFLTFLLFTPVMYFVTLYFLTDYFIHHRFHGIYPVIHISYNIWLIILCEHFAVYRIKSRDVRPKIRRSFYYHLAFFCGILPLPSYIFFLIVSNIFLSTILTLTNIVIWGDIVLIHSILSKIASNGIKERDVGDISIKNFSGFSEESLRITAFNKVRFRISLQVHSGLFIGICSYILLSTFLSAFWLYGGFYIQLLFILIWYIFLSLHWTAYAIYAYGVYPKVKQGYYYNLIAFIASIPIQLLTMLWLIIGPIWTIAILVHCITYRIISRKSEIKEGIKKTHLHRLVEKEMEKMRDLL